MTLLDFFYTYLPSNSIPLYDLPSRLILSVQSALVCLSDLFSHSGTINYAPTNTLNFSVKLLMCLAFLILIRGGVPRYRYDFLTKLGWVKFLGYVLTTFVLTTLLFFVW